MSATVYNSPENINLEVTLVEVNGGGSRFVRNFSMYLSHCTVSHATEEQFS